MTGYSIFNTGAWSNDWEPVKKYSQEEYRIWRRQYVFDALSGLTYGESFCQYFKVRDNLLNRDTGLYQTDEYIRNTYVV